MFSLPISTLRYYDKEGLFPNIERQSGIRKFSENEIEALHVIECLKTSGLEIKDIRQFMDWVKEGASTYEKRKELFEARKEAVEAETAVLVHILHILRIVERLVGEPYVTGVKEQCAMKVAKQLATIFEVANELDITIAQQIAETFIRQAGKTARTYPSNGEGTDAVGTTGIEHLGHGYTVAIAIGIDNTGIDMGHQVGIAAERPGLGEVGFDLQELGIGILEQLLVLIVPFLACGHHGQRRNVTRLSNSGLPTDGVQQVSGTGVGVGIAHLGDEVVLHSTL